MMRTMNKKRIAIIISLVGCLFVLLLLLIKQNGLKEEKPATIEKPTDSYYISTENSPYSEEYLNDIEYMIPLYKADYEMNQDTEKTFFISNKEHNLDTDFPFYQNDGAVLYCQESNYQYIFDDLTSASGDENAYISCGLTFDAANQKLKSQKVVFIQLKNHCLINSLPVRIQNDRTYEIPANSILFFTENKIAVYTYHQTQLQKIIIDIPENSVMDFGTMRRGYESFYQYLKNNNDSSYLSVTTLNDDFYYYFLGNKYTLDHPITLYPTSNGYLVDQGDSIDIIGSEPLFSATEKKVVLTKAYDLVQPCQYFVNCLPAFSKITMDEYAVYFENKEMFRAMNDVFLFDGKNCYLFFSESTLKLGKKEITLAPFTSIDMSDEQKVYVFDYNTEEATSYDRNGNHIDLEIFDSIVVHLDQQSMTRRDGKSELLIQQPELLPTLE